MLGEGAMGHFPRHPSAGGAQMEDTHSKITTPVQRVRAASPQPSQHKDRIFPLVDLVLPENIFHSQLTKERRRADRSRKPFVLMLLDAHPQNASAAGILQEALTVLATAKRETDLVGWYKEGAIAGVIFTEVNVNGEHAIMKMLRGRTERALAQRLGPGIAASFAISMHVFPESWDPQHSSWAADSKL
jgi:hypothetical protein